VSSVDAATIKTQTLEKTTVDDTNAPSYMEMNANVYKSDENLQAYLSNLQDYVNAVKTAAGSTPLNEDQLKAITKAEKSMDAAFQLRAGYALMEAQVNSYNTLKQIEGSGLWFQTGANSMQGISVGVGSVKSDVLGIGNGFGESTIQVDQASGTAVSSYIDIVDNALQYVTAQRAKLGAVQNRMEYTKSSLDISSENLSASESRIRDADMAKEMMRMTASNVLQQAGVSMLAQANQAPQSVLSLLQ
jgi:flagellin-like hook-associated protein FlgL